jgi:hypothetical protein
VLSIHFLKDFLLSRHKPAARKVGKSFCLLLPLLLRLEFQLTVVYSTGLFSIWDIVHTTTDIPESSTCSTKRSFPSKVIGIKCTLEETRTQKARKYL